MLVTSNLLNTALHALNNEGDKDRAFRMARKILDEHPNCEEAPQAQAIVDELAAKGLVAEVAPDLMTSTTDEIDGYSTLKNLGVVRGSSVRARNIGSDIGAQLKSIVGGELKGVTKLIEDGREQAFSRMSCEAVSLGANAVKGLRFSTSQVWEGAAEVMAYGTAVVVAPSEHGDQPDEADPQCE